MWVKGSKARQKTLQSCIQTCHQGTWPVHHVTNAVCCFIWLSPSVRFRLSQQDGNLNAAHGLTQCSEDSLTAESVVQEVRWCWQMT